MDPRLHAWREDLADIALKGRVKADRFVEPVACQVTAPLADIVGAPRFDAPVTAQALMGAKVRVFEQREGWAWMQLVEDGYVGYVAATALSTEFVEPTHWVCVPSTFVYPAPDLKSAPASAVYLNTRLAVCGGTARFVRLHDGRFVFRDHLKPVGENMPDPVTVAEWFVHVPYLWGGNAQTGLDCSGLVQLAYHAAGRACPRDSDMMAHMLGIAIDATDLTAFQRGDLVFWHGHVAMMVDNFRLIHANGHHMAAVIEPVVEAVERIGALHGPVTGARRWR